MKKLITFLFLTLLGLQSFAQTLSPKVSPSSGGYATGNNGVSLSWTMGETFTTTLSGGGQLLSQGEQQPEIDLLTGSTATSVCAGSSFSVPYTANGYVDATNVFTAQLSDASGSFASAVNIGAATATLSGTIAATIPAGTPAGSGYRVRVVSGNPARAAADNGVNITVNALVQYYVDADGDGYSNGTEQFCSGNTIPQGYSDVSNGDDCNDYDAGVHEPVLYYIDADQDGFDAGIEMICSSTPIEGFSSTTNGSDCNDNAAYVSGLAQFYVDADHDGYGSTTTALLCSDSPPPGYSMNNTDCNDADANAFQIVNLYEDADGDGYESGAGLQSFCLGNYRPAGYTENTLGVDCDDSDADIHQPVQYYVDSDQDGYGSTTTAMLCSSTAPAGYSTNNSDCNDNNTNVNPGATEICNGIDDNCDGIVDFGPLGIPTSVNGPSSVCRTQSFVFTTDAVAGATSYQWILPSNATGTSTSNSISVTFSNTFIGGSICVKAVNACGVSAQVCKTLTAVTAISATPATISGTTSVCVNASNLTYTIAAVANASSYVWTAPANATLVSGQGTTSATFSFQSAYTTGSISVKSSNCFGTSAARTLTVTKQAISATPGSVTGPASFCPGTQQTFSIAAVSGASSYTWTAPANASIVSGQGGLSVVVEFTSAFISGNVSVVSSNCSGTSAARTKSVTRTTLPGTVGTISGVSAGACSAQTRTYSVVALSNTTSYDWTAPVNANILSGQGTTSVVVQFAAGFTTGTLSVKGVNCSGTSATARTLAITNVTSTPSILSGQATAVCAGSTQTYSTSSIAGATSYVWTVPTGALINGANNGTSISVTFPIPFTSGVVSVKSATACYTSAAKSLTVSSLVSQPGSITGTSTNLCSGGSFTYSIPAVTGATGYSWNVPAGWTITANSGTSITVSIPTTGFTSASISVAAQNACGFGTARSLTLSALPSTPTAISGSNAVCPSATGLVYSTPAIVGLTSYTWTVSTGATITSGQGTNSIVVNWGTSAGTVSVKAKNICGTNNTARTFAVGLVACRLDEEVAEETSVESAMSKELSVYPNPTAGNANVVFGSEVGGKYTINVLNALGQVVYSKIAMSTTGENTHAIDISELSSGLYFINLIEDGGMRSLRLLKK